MLKILPMIPCFSQPFTKSAMTSVLSSRVPLIHLNNIFTKPLSIWKSSPGLPFRLMGFKTKGEVRDDFHQRNNIRLFCHQIKTGKRIALPDCCAYVRSHLAPPGEEKVRAVWGYPMALTLAEAIFAIPLTDAFSVTVINCYCYLNNNSENNSY